MRTHILKAIHVSIMTLASASLAAGMLSVYLTAPAHAQGLISEGTDIIGEEFERGGGLTAEDPRRIAARIINIFLGFLGLVALGIILLGGFRWMTAQGNEDKVEEAKRILTAGIIGLVIIVSAWAIANWLITKFLEQNIVR